jgi:hypothetical protein
VAAAFTGPTDCEPDVGLLPVQAPLAVHAVAFAAFHVNVTEPPLVTWPALEPKVSVGAGATVAAATSIVTDLLAEPPAPVHVIVNVPALVNGPVD